jgi:tape measure domain-containing protein
MANVNITVSLQGAQQMTAALNAMQAQLRALGNQAKLTGQAVNQGLGAGIGNLGRGLRGMGVQAGFAAQGLRAAQTQMTAATRTAAATGAGVGRLQNAFAMLGNGFARVQGGIAQLSSSFSNMGANFARFQQRALVSAAFFGLIAVAVRNLAGGLLGLADSYTQLQARLQIVSTSAANNAEQMETIFKIAQETRTGLDAVGRTYTRIAINGERLGMSQEQVAQMTRTLAEALQLSGSTAEEAANGMIQLTQAMSKGKLDGDELRSVFENMPLVVKAMEEATGKTRGELYKLAAQGKITASVLIGSVLSAGGDIHELFLKMPRTFEQAGTQLQNAFMKAVGGANAGNAAVNQFNDTLDVIRAKISTPEFQTFIFKTLTTMAKGFMAAVNAAIEFRGELSILATSWEALKLTQGDGLRGAEMLWNNVLSATKDNVEELREYIALRREELGLPAPDRSLPGDPNTTSVSKSSPGVTPKPTPAGGQFSGALGDGGTSSKTISAALSETKSLLESIRSPAEQYAETMKKVSLAQGEVAITAEQMGRMQAKAALDAQSLNNVQGQIALKAEQVANASVHAAATAVPPIQQIAATWGAVSAAVNAGQLSVMTGAQVMAGAIAPLADSIGQIAQNIGSALTTAFGENKAVAIAMAIINTLVGMTKALAEGGPFLGPAMAASIAAMGFAQVAKIASTEPGSSGASAGSGAATTTKAGKGGGKKAMATGGWVPGQGHRDTVAAMLTPGEFVINKKSAAKHHELLQELNSNRFASGGMVGRGSGSGGGATYGGTTIILRGNNVLDNISLARFERRIKDVSERTERRRHGKSR